MVTVKNTVTFGSKAKLLPPSDPDVLDLGDNDTDIYLSEIDGPETSKKISSVIVKPTKIASYHSVPPNPFERVREKNRSNNNNRAKKSRRETFQRARGPSVISQNSHRAVTAPTDSRHVVLRNPSHKATETRGTQTERTGACKCARATQTKNQRRRLDNKKNKLLIEAFATA